MTNYYKELTEHTGMNMSTITDVEFLYNTLTIEQLHGLQLPAWTDNFYNNEMREIAARGLALFTNGIIQKRLRGGTMVSLEHFLNYIARFCIVNCIDISRPAGERDLVPYGREYKRSQSETILLLFRSRRNYRERDEDNGIYE